MSETWGDEAVLSDIWIQDKTSVLQAIDEHKPDAVVNAAGIVGQPNVDWCETHPIETYQGNTQLPLIIAEACQERGVYFLHLGTGCIFYGASPDPRGWLEDDDANPAAVYTRSKYAADLVLSRLPNVAIVRLRMPIDHTPSQKNLIDKLIRYTQVIDVENSVTIVDDLVSAIKQIIEKRGVGIFHCVNPGIMRHRELIDLYHQYVDPTHTCEWIREEDLLARGLTLKKRSNNIMQSPRLAALGITMRPIHEALRDTMIRYAQHVMTPLNRPIDQGVLNQAHTTTVQPFNFIRQHKREMKGVILAGGKGTRLAPLTHVTNKHLVPVFNKQMILYPLQTLLDSGIRQILLITSAEFCGQFMNLLGSGASLGCRLTYRVQDESGGIAHALGMAEDFVDGNNCTVILGDNIFDENFLPHVSSFQTGAVTFYKPVDDPERFGVVDIDSFGNVLSIEEKPKQPKSNFAQVGFYLYDPHVFEIIKTVKPSTRGELEIAEVNSRYLAEQKLIAKPVRGFWSDAGTFPSLKRASDYFAQKEGIH